MAEKEWHYGQLSGSAEGAAACYAMVNRYGGGSTSSFASMNVGLYVGDERNTVLRNRKHIQQKLGLTSLCFARQRHGVNILSIESKNPEAYTVDIGGDKGCDALLTRLSGVGLAVQHADCQAVLLYDCRHFAIAAVHCGWRGSVQNILGAVLARMAVEYGTNPAEVKAVIGPALGRCCAEFVHYQREFPEDFYPYMASADHFDFYAISTMQLVAAGVCKEQVMCVDNCTSCSVDYFSYRRSCRQGEEQTGRNCSVIWLPEESCYADTAH